MARNVNLSNARIALAAINLTLNNGKKFENLGFMQALRSPQLAGLIEEMNPVNAQNDGRLSIIGGQATPQARVTLNYRPQISATVKTTRTVATGSNPADSVALNVDYVTHRELDRTLRTVDLLKMEKEAELYLDQVNKGIINGGANDYKLLGIWGEDACQTIENVLTSMNSAVGTSLIAGAGGNLLIGQVSPANVAVPNVIAFNTDGSLRLDLYDWIMDLKQVHAMQGKPIVIGGSRALKYMRKKGVASTASLGYDYKAMYDLLEIEFYYDPLVDTLSGSNHIIVIDPGAACLETLLEHGSVIKPKKVGNTSYGNISVNIAQTNAPTFTMDMDFRVKEDDSTSYPTYTYTPSSRFGTFLRPAGFFKNYGGWDTVTGVFRANLTIAA
ncbi:hypothetical protein [Arsenicibacter rosenii]|uniref:N4-gp56 family major capsid protein n=1 Tax=Arsenicibacter rosenii TaxID=1750698 RepID=A0A1S2VA86_9BACT|nr:hypothetical protein [Arsenicibacter rosenii]OIN55657.1 hypothetical protein BLX24_28900 [Arsenicibacter rosenii]